MNGLIQQFANDREVQVVAALVALDFVLGVAAAVKGGSFRLSYLADVLRNDVIGKVIPYYAIWAAVTLGGDISIGGVGIKDVVAAAVVAALSGSVLSSLKDLGLWQSAPAAIAGPDPSSPAPPQ